MTIYTDDFERPNASTLGADWSTPSWSPDACAISGGNAIYGGSQDSYAAWAGAGTWGRRQRSEITVGSAAGGDYLGPCAYVTDAGGCYYVRVRGAALSLQIHRVDNAGVQTQLGDGESLASYALGDTLAIEVDDDGSGGTTIEAYHNGSLIATRTVTSSPLTSGVPGMCVERYGRDEVSDWQADDFAAGDTTDPTLTSPSGTATGETTLDGSVSTDEANGTLSWVATTSATAPSVAQVKAGEDHTGAAAADSGSQVVSTTGTQSVSASGLTEDTGYYLHFQHTDAAANDSTVVSSAQVTTDAAAETVTVTITDESEAALPNETGIDWYWSDSFGVITDSGAGEATDGSGVMTVSLPNTGLVPGNTGFLTVKLASGHVGVTEGIID